jgi:hypothetical protein
MNSDILRIEDVEVIRSHHTEEIELRVHAIVADIVQTAPAVLYPGIAEPAQYGPAHCTATVTVYLDDVQWEVQS